MLTLCCRVTTLCRMPAWPRRELFQLSMLLLCVPVQYLISNHWSFGIQERDNSLKSLINSMQEFKHRYLEFESLKSWILSTLQSRVSIWMSHYHSTDVDPGESPAIEVMRYRDRNGYFASSPEIRISRSPDVKFRVGQVVTHKTWGYTGVIVGWDPIANAPDSWLNSMHPRDKGHWREMPNYAVMVDVRDRPKPQITYVPQDNLKSLVNTKIKHPKLDDYFSGFDGAQYLPRPWLKALYPAD